MELFTTTDLSPRLAPSARHDTTFQQAIEAEIIKQLSQREIHTQRLRRAIEDIRRIPVHKPFVNFLIVETSGRCHHAETQAEVLQIYSDTHRRIRCGAILIDVAEIRTKPVRRRVMSSNFRRMHA